MRHGCTWPSTMADKKIILDLEVYQELRSKYKFYKKQFRELKDECLNLEEDLMKYHLAHEWNRDETKPYRIEVRRAEKRDLREPCLTSSELVLYQIKRLKN